MTDEEKAKRVGQWLPLCDSDQFGEALAAFEKLRALGKAASKPIFGDIGRALLSSVTPEQLEAVEQALAQRDEENSRLTERETALKASLATVRSALWVAIHWDRLAAIGVAMALGFGGYCWSHARAVPPETGFGRVTTEPAAVDAEFRRWLDGQRWVDGDAPPVVITVRGTEYWALVRGTIDAGTHVDAKGRPLDRHCLALYASEAERHAGGYRTPEPYAALGAWMKWPMHVAECRMPWEGPQ